MKKRFITMITFLFLIGTAATSAAVPFIITGSDLAIDWKWGNIGATYTPNEAIDPFDLAEGQQSETIIFGTLELDNFLVGRSGEATFDLFFGTPDMEGGVQTSGDITVWRSIRTLFFTKKGEIQFGPSDDFAYSYNGQTGGIMTLEMFEDKDCAFCGGLSFIIAGTITNKQTPVTEPATTLMLGAFLVGIAGISRKKLLK